MQCYLAIPSLANTASLRLVRTRSTSVWSIACVWENSCWLPMLLTVSCTHFDLQSPSDLRMVCNPFGGLGLTGGIVDIGGLYDCLAGIYEGRADPPFSTSIRKCDGRDTKKSQIRFRNQTSDACSTKIQTRLSRTTTSSSCSGAWKEMLKHNGTSCVGRML